MGIFCYFSGSPFLGLVGLDIGYELCFVDIGAFCLYGVFDYN
jgi:hypothetical protein